MVSHVQVDSSNFTLPVSASWLYVPSAAALRTDSRLSEEFDRRLRENSSCSSSLGVYSWASSSLRWDERAVSAWESFTTSA